MKKRSCWSLESKMDQPSTSNTENRAEETQDEANQLPNTQIRIYSHDGLEMEESDRSFVARHLPSVEDIIAECEIRLRRYMKRRRREHGPNAIINYNFFDPDDDSSNSSNVSLSSSLENLYIDFNEDPSAHIPMNIAERERRKARLTVGSWLFLSFINGGWSYENTKNFLMQEYGVKCLRSRSVSDRLGFEEEYKAVVKFRSSEELDRVLKSLIERKIDDKFLFFSFDKMPVTSYDSDSDSDDYRINRIMHTSEED